MRRSSRSRCLWLGAWVWLGWAAASAQGLIAETLRVPIAAAGPEGLETLVVRPMAAGRHPLALLSHGSPRRPEDRPTMNARGMLAQLTSFARRGFVAAGVMRRGYGTSPGGWAEGYGPCGGADYVAAGRAGAADLRAAITELSKRPDVNPARVLAVGRSAGGFATLALTADPPPGLVAAISFAGGRGSMAAGEVCSPDALIDAFRTFGTGSRVPTLWVYARNDRYFGPDLAERLLSAFRGGGGTATFVSVPAYGTDGHELFSEGGRSIWTPIVDRFLNEVGLPGRDVAAPRPKLEPPRQLKPSALRDFDAYLDAPAHKAFAVADDGAHAWRTARDTVAEAIEAALQDCRTRTAEQCRVYAADAAYAAR